MHVVHQSSSIRRAASGWITGVLLAILCIGISRAAAAQGASEAHRTTKMIKSGPVGLPETAKVNSTMFAGIELTVQQGKEIERLAEKFAQEDSDRKAKHPVTGPLDSAAKAKLAPAFEQQRLAYRAVLTPDQQKIYDQNTQRILQAWLNARPQPATR